MFGSDRETGHFRRDVMVQPYVKILTFSDREYSKVATAHKSEGE